MPTATECRRVRAVGVGIAFRRWRCASDEQGTHSRRGVLTVTEAKLTVELADGRLISVPLAWYPRLVHATPAERNNWELIAANRHIHWEDLDEDISVEGLLAGRRSGESEASFKRWLKAKRAGRGIALYELGRAKR